MNYSFKHEVSKTVILKESISIELKKHNCKYKIVAK